MKHYMKATYCLCLLLVLNLAVVSCTTAEPTADATPSLTNPTPIANATVEGTTAVPSPTGESATSIPSPTAEVGQPTATQAPPDPALNNDLASFVKAALPENAYDDVGVLPLYAPGWERPLWAVYSQGWRNFELTTPPSHFVAIYTRENDSWLELASQELNVEGNFGSGPDFIFPEGIVQADLEPTNIWLIAEGGVGAHSGTFELLRFDGTTLYMEINTGSSSQGVGYLEDVNGDGASEIILRLHDYYVFCYACGVRYLNFGVYTWDASSNELREVTLQWSNQNSDPARHINRAVELANADLWPDALATIEEAERLAAQTAVFTDDAILEWDTALIRFYNQAYQAELNHSSYPLLTNIFYGDFAAALEIMRPYNQEALFSATPPVIQGTVAEGNEQWLADYLQEQTNAAIAAEPDLAAAYYFRAWAAYLDNPADPQIAADLQQAALLAPNEPLFSQTELPTANRIQFGAGETAATLTGNLQPQGMAVYILAAQAGQTMTVMLTTPDDQTHITVLDGQGGYVEGQMSTTFWQGTLPDTDDYVIRVFAGEAAVDYTLQVILPQRISFAPGTTSATVQGDVAAHVSDDYILSAQADQTMRINIDSPNSNVLLTIVGADGIPLTNGNMSGATSWQGQLPATQDYTLRAIGTLEPASYTLTVTIE